jgi:hypothetical protein
MKRKVHKKRLMLERDITRILSSADLLNAQVLGGSPTTTPPDACHGGSDLQSECC